VNVKWQWPNHTLSKHLPEGIAQPHCVIKNGTHKNNIYLILQTPQQYYTCAQWEVYQMNILNVLLFQHKIPVCLCACGVIRMVSEVFAFLGRCVVQVGLLIKQPTFTAKLGQSSKMHNGESLKSDLFFCRY